MPTVMRIGNLRVVIYPNDHRPCHVHVIGNGSEAVYYLNCPEGPSSLRENYGFTHQELNRIEESLDANISSLCLRWEEIHGDF